MRYMYTTKPDEGCHEVESGIYGRPVRTCDEAKLKAEGWSLNISELRGAYVRQEKEGRQEEGEVTDDLVDAYKEKFGRKPHHKMKAETIREKLEESDD